MSDTLTRDEALPEQGALSMPRASVAYALDGLAGDLCGIEACR